MPDTYTLSESGASVDALLDVIGTDALTTTAQTLTGAVNELQGEVGDLTNLATTDKSNVVSAVNEVANDVRGGDLFKLVQYTAAYTVAANDGGTLNANQLSVSTPTGYNPVAISKFSSGASNVVVRYCDARASGTTTMVAYRNLSSGSVSATFTFTILYVKVWS